MLFSMKRTLTASAVLCVMHTAQAEAEIIQLNPQPQHSTVLPAIVVTATRSAEKLDSVPARVAVIRPQDIDQSPISQMSDLLRSDASINMVQLGGLGQNSSIFLRGTDSDHTLVLRDGVRLNAGSSGMAPLQFLDTTDVHQIEVLKGPASVLYGSDAIGGVVQIISKKPEKNRAFITAETGEDRTYKSIIGADLAEDGIYAQVRAQRLESNATKVFDIDGLNSASYDQKGWSAKAGTEQENYGLSFDYSHNEGRSLYIGCAESTLDYDCLSYKNTAQDFENEIINLRSRLQLNSQLELNTRLSQFKDNIKQLSTADFLHNTAQEAEVFSKYQLNAANLLSAGITHRNVKADVLSYGDAYQQDYSTTGYYLQHQYQTEKLNTQLGIRLEDNEKYGSHTVGQAAVRYQLLPKTSIFANAGTAFKAPTLDELYNGWSGNAHLKPEESASYEIGVDQKLSGGFSTGLSLYRTAVEGLIQNDAKNKLANISKARIQGAESYLQWQQGQWNSKLSYHYVQAENADTHQDLQRRPHQSLSLSAGWENELYGVNALLTAKSSAEDYQARTPGYATVDLHGFWKISPHLKAFTNLQNIGNHAYKTASYGDGMYYMNGGRLASVGFTVDY